MGKKVLITGALGYLGTRLRPYLRDRGHHCVGFDTGFFKDGIMFPSGDEDVSLGT